MKKFFLIAAVLIGFAVYSYNGAPAQQSQQSPPAKKITVPSRPQAKIGVTTGYISGEPLLNTDGLCEFTVDNTQNDMPVYVRIWDVDSGRPVRAFTIAKGDKFTAYDLSPGTYEVRYRELYEDNAPPFGSKSEPTTLEQHETFDGTQYSIVELTLYKVHNGNTTTTRIDAADV